MLKIMDRDGLACHLCLAEVADTKVPHPFAPTLDHVVPLGPGDHTMANIRLAHFICNSIKQDRQGLPREFFLSHPSYRRAFSLR